MKKLVKKKVVYDRQTLFDQVWEEPVTKVAQKYGVSDVMIHKYCRKIAIPTPSPGYWRKKERGLKVQRKPRLPRFSGEQTITGLGMFEEDVAEEMHPTDVVDKINNEEDAVPNDEVGTATPEPQTETIDPYKLSDELEEKCNKAASSVEIVARRKWHPVIEKHRAVFSEWAKENRWTDDLAKHGEKQWEWHPYHSPELWEQITLKTIPKFHLLANAIILALESVGCSVTDDFYALIGEEKIKFGAYETRERVLHEPVGYEKKWIQEHPGQEYDGPSMRKYDYRRNGELNFYIHRTFRGYYHVPEIVQEKRFDNQTDFVSAIVRELFHAVPYVRKERLEWEEEERKRNEAHERWVRKNELISSEKKRVYELKMKTDDFVLANSIRAMIVAFESKQDLSDEEKEWILWAKGKADWIDPTIRKVDDILGEFKKEYLEPEPVKYMSWSRY